MTAFNTFLTIIINLEKIIALGLAIGGLWVMLFRVLARLGTGLQSRKISILADAAEYTPLKKELKDTGVFREDNVRRLKPEDMDSVEIGLITCSPHEEIYSLYGHTALRCHNMKNGTDITFNYGMFNFKAPYFALRFVFGKTDYELGVVPTDFFCKYYKDWGSQVTEQVLNLTTEEKWNILQALFINLQPENCTYRYNYLYDNCSTRPRNIIARHLQGRIIYEERPDYTPTYREMIHELTKHHEWATMGNDLLLGVKADMKTTREQQEFLPLNLLYDFDHAQVYANGIYRQLVKERRILVPAGIQMIEKDFPLSPTDCAILLLLVCLSVLMAEWKLKRHFVIFDACLMLATGLAGCIVFVMFFSEHPATSTNLQILILNPLSLFFIPQVFRGKKTRWFVISLCATILFLIGGLWQDYAEGMYILALCLLLRYWRHRHEK